MANRRSAAPSMAETFNDIRSDYDAARDSRYRRRRVGLNPSGSGADYHMVESDYLKVMEQARDMDRNDVVVGQAIDRSTNNIIQEGFTLDAMTGDEAVDADLLAMWKSWSESPDDCDLAGELCWHDMERLAVRQSDVDGDIVALGTRGGQLEFVEAHRIRTPTNTKRNVVLGVLLDEYRRRQEYWLTKDDLDPRRSVSRVSDMTPYPVRDPEGNRQIFHVYDPRRVTQTRGITALAPIFNAAGMFEDINFAKMVQQQVVSCFAIIRTRAAGNGSLPTVDAQYGERSTVAQGDGSSRRVEGIAPGMEIRGEDGETISGFSPNVPNAEFFDHVKLILTLVGINLGMPLVMLLMDASETNFSGFRGAVDEARKGFRHKQRNLRNRLHTPVYHWKVRQWMASNPALEAAANRSGINIFAHAWRPPRWPYLQPLQDAQADALRLEKNLTSPQRLHAERGADFDEVMDETISDNYSVALKAIRAAQKLKEETKESVDWHEMLYLPVSSPASVVAQAQAKFSAESKVGEE